ncbi:hypothetical protein [Sphingomonas sp. GM_Shp_1]|uniref:hypothetical protein n=1 Tax=Sphingomonas sp. GM_Shp_1 TaxID=2937381 RepID=UPI00226B321F|nr:hypothetical protein [Sphingomonas sp. GM_Shp_1]
MTHAIDPLTVYDEDLFDADASAARGWLRRVGTATARQYAVLAAFGSFASWMAFGAYAEVFGLLSSGGDLSSDAQPLFGLAFFGAMAIACVLGMFVLPRWEPQIADNGAARYLLHARTAVIATSILIAPWFDFKVPLALLVPLIVAGVYTKSRTEAGGIDPAAFLLNLVCQSTWTFLSMTWLVLWCDMWLHNANFRLPQATANAAPLIMVLIVLSGCVVQSAMRLRDRRWPLAGLAFVAAAIGLANPGVSGLVGVVLYKMDVGGGVFDVGASAVGRPVCDMGVPGRHYYILAGDEGCTLKRANRLLGTLRRMPDRERVAFLLTNRVQPAPAAQ